MRVCEGRVCMSVSVSVCAHTSMHIAFLGDPRESVVNELASSRMWVQSCSPAPCSGERVSDSTGRSQQEQSPGGREDTHIQAWAPAPSSSLSWAELGQWDLQVGFRRDNNQPQAAC